MKLCKWFLGLALLASVVRPSLGFRPCVGFSNDPGQGRQVVEDNPREQRFITGHVYAGTDPEAREPVADAVVYLASAEAPPPDVDLEPVTAKVTGGRLVPDYIVVTVGQKLVVVVEDEEPYAILFNSSKEGAGTALPPDLTRWEKTFTKPTDMASITCGIHPKLRGVVTVVPGPAFVRTEKDGSYRIRIDLSHGRAKLRAFHPGHGGSTLSIPAGRDEDGRLDFFLKPTLQQRANGTAAKATE